MSELKACPFCGGTKIKKHHDDGQFWNTCQTCFADGPPTCKRGSGHDWNARALPEGYVLVPVEPTGVMEEAGCQGYMEADGSTWIMHRSSMGHAYKAMLAAAQEAGHDAKP